MEKRREIGCQPYDVTVITTDATRLRRRTATGSAETGSEVHLNLSPYPT